MNGISVDTLEMLNTMDGQQKLSVARSPAMISNSDFFYLINLIFFVSTDGHVFLSLHFLHGPCDIGLGPLNVDQC